MNSYSKKTESEEIFFLNRKSSLHISEPKNRNVFEPANKVDKTKYKFVVDWQLY
jgi:hypothetical protein